MKGKTPPVEMERRLLQIQDWIIDGISSGQIIISCLENAWCTSERHAERLIATAKERWLKEQNADLLEKRIVKLKELEQLKTKLEERYKGHPAGIMAIARVENLIIKLMGLNAPLKVQHSGPEGGAILHEMAVKHSIDYTLLSTEALKEIMNARIKPNT